MKTRVCVSGGKEWRGRARFDLKALDNKTRPTARRENVILKRGTGETGRELRVPADAEKAHAL